MKIFLIELCQKSPRWSRPIRHTSAKNANEAKRQFAYLLNNAASGEFLRAHELKYNEFAKLNGCEDCADCFDYLHTTERYICDVCGNSSVQLSKYDLAEGEGQVNCEYCGNPLVKASSLQA